MITRVAGHTPEAEPIVVRDINTEFVLLQRAAARFSGSILFLGNPPRLEVPVQDEDTVKTYRADELDIMVKVMQEL